MSDTAIVQSGKSFWNMGGGAWAGDQLLKALKAGRALSPSELRTCDTLQKNEWEHLDEALVEEAIIRLRGIADLMAAGLTIPVPNAMGHTMFQWERVSDMNPAEVSLSGIPRTEDDRVDFDLQNLPLPITHKDFNINLRTLAASRNRGEALDTTQARLAGRLVAEELERMLFQGGKTFGGATIYGLTTHPNRNTAGFGTNGAWSASAKTGENILDDLLTMLAGLEGDRMYGPYMLYVPSNTSVKLENDFKANSDKTIRERIKGADRIVDVRVVDQLPADNVVLVQWSRDTVALVDGEPMQTVQWDIEGGFILKFKAFAIQVPLIRADQAGRSGVFHMS